MTKNIGKKITFLCITAALSLGATVTSNAQSLEDVLAGEHRSASNKSRDQFRHPAETLKFFGIKNNMTVVEIDAGGGWYQEVLAPYLNKNGNYISATAEKGTDRYKREKARHEASPDLYSNVKMVPLSGDIYGEKESADMVLSFRNYHNWTGSSEFEKLRAMYNSLKPGGILGMVDHRSDNAGDGGGYTCEPCMIKDAEAIGFEYVGTSQINANPKDTKNYPGGVWNLPPTLSKDGLDEKMLNELQTNFNMIGESDRYTLKFVKPKS